MSAKLFVGVDIGTQAVKAAVYDAEGRCRGEASRKSDLLRPLPGVVEEDPEQQVRAACEVIAECAAHASGSGSVCALSIDGQMAGVIGVGEDGRNVTPYDSWLDTRCAPWIECMQKEAGPEIVRKAGGPPSFNHGPKILWWKNERPDTYARIRSFVQPGGYAVMRLCGLDGSQAFIDTSYLHFSGFADSRAATWDPALCGDFGVDPGGSAPHRARPTQVMGGLTAEMAARLRPSGRDTRDGGVRRHRGELPLLRRRSTRRLRGRGGHRIGLRCHDGGVPGGRRGDDPELRPLRGSRALASVRVHQWRRHEP